MIQKICAQFRLGGCRTRKRSAGFTLLEVLVATGLFGLAILAIVQSRSNSLRNVAKSEKLSTALQLLQSKMTEMEMKFQASLDKNGLKAAIAKENGAFESPYENYTWTAELKEAGFELTSELLIKLFKDFGMEEDDAIKQVDSQKLVLVNLNQTMKDNFSELVVKVQWDEFGHKVDVPLVTHLIPKKPKIALKLSE